jgi:Tfp pilus assembly protein PilN
MEKPYQAPRGRLLSTFVFFLLGVLVLYSGFLFIQKVRLDADQANLQEEIGTLEIQIEVLKDEQIEAFYVAQERVESLKENRLLWSSVIRKLQDLSPVSVFISSYAGGEDGSIQVSAIGNSYDSVADTIKALELSADFENPFSSSSTLGTTNEGQQVVSFSLQVDTASSL